MHLTALFVSQKLYLPGWEEKSPHDEGIIQLQFAPLPIYHDSIHTHPRSSQDGGAVKRRVTE